jgi:hypothetical protein
MSAELQARFSRYSELIGSALASDFSADFPAEDAESLQVERGTVYCSALTGSLRGDDPRMGRILELTRGTGLHAIAVVDRMGHHRPLYRPVLVYACLRAFTQIYETISRSDFGRWEEGLRVWADLIEAELGQLGRDDSMLLAGKGDSVAEGAWSALALAVAGKLFIRDAWTDLASDFFGTLARRQQANGPFLRADRSDNPETHWYHELAILHAAAAYAVQSEDRPLSVAVRRNTQWHAQEVQPDHAAGGPLGLFAFLWNPDTSHLADQVLHTVRTEFPEGATGFSAILLTDSLYCLRQFLTLDGDAPGR